MEYQLLTLAMTQVQQLVVLELEVRRPELLPVLVAALPPWAVQELRLGLVLLGQEQRQQVRVLRWWEQVLELRLELA